MSDQQISMFADAGPAAGGKTVSFTVNRTVNAAAQATFDRWLIPVFLEGWMFGAHSGDEAIEDLANTVRKGGDFAYKVKRDGKSVTFHGSYEELDIPRLLVFSWQQDDREAERCHFHVAFNEEAGKTRLKLQAKIPEQLAEQRDSIKQLWSERLNKLAEGFRK